MVLPADNHTRRWPRYPVALPARVISTSRAQLLSVPGLVTELSQGGIAIYAGIQVEPGDLTEVEFQTPCVRVAGVIRNRDGFCFGLEFLTPVVTGSRLPSPAVGNSLRRYPAQLDSQSIEDAEASPLVVFLRRHYDHLRRTRQETKRLQAEVASLRRAAAWLRKDADKAT